jgi:hypothetical protein
MSDSVAISVLVTIFAAILLFSFACLVAINRCIRTSIPLNGHARAPLT